MKIRMIVVGVVIAALVGSVVTVRAIGRSTAAVDHQAPVQVAPVSVNVVVAHRSAFTTSITAKGSVASGREAKIAPKATGRVASVLVREGQHVTAGTPLLQLDTSDLLTQQAQALASVAMARARLADLLAGARPQEREQAANAVAQAKATFDLAQADVQRMRTLSEMGAISRQQLDIAETQLRVAQAGYDSARQRQGLVEQGSRTEEIAMARAQLAQAQAILAGAHIRLNDATTTAPFAGTIVQRMIEPGETSSPAIPAFILADLKDINVELAVPERYRAVLRLGQSATVVVDALPGTQFVGRIEEIRPAEALASRSFLVKVHVPNPQELLKPGMFARATITLAVRPNVLQIPEGTLVLTSTQPVVFIVRDGKAISREVTLGDRQGGFVEVTSGLGEGDVVAADGAAGLSDGQSVVARSRQ
jgi:multidrug efflux pump subunit AcrA (membrane-fusion protein)